MTGPDQGLRPVFTSHLRQVHWQPIESWWMAAGIPDLNGCWRGTEVWIECKRAEGARLDTVKVRPPQVGWSEARTRAGGRVFVAVRRHKGRLDEVHLFDVTALRLLRDGKKLPMLKPLLISCGGPAKWDWTRIQRILFR